MSQHEMAPRLFRPHGGYQRLIAYQKAVVVFDGTGEFCRRYVDPHSRTYDQMVQAARSGKQNIVEGNRAAATSAVTEIRLTNVARASLDELLEDYTDYLRNHGVAVWDKDAPEALAVRRLGRAEEDRVASGSAAGAQPAGYALYQPYVARSGGWAANTLLCLIHQTNYLLDRLLASQETRFVSEGGFAERLTAVRRRYRNG